MIAHAGLLSYRMGYTTPLEDTTITQRYASLDPAETFAEKRLVIVDSVPTKCSSTGALDHVVTN